MHNKNNLELHISSYIWFSSDRLSSLPTKRERLGGRDHNTRITFMLKYASFEMPLQNDTSVLFLSHDHETRMKELTYWCWWWWFDVRMYMIELEFATASKSNPVTHTNFAHIGNIISLQTTLEQKTQMSKIARLDDYVIC